MRTKYPPSSLAQQRSKVTLKIAVQVEWHGGNTKWEWAGEREWEGTGGRQ